MREIKYLSPSGISRYRKDPEDFYMRYLAHHKLGDEPQTQPMSIGSAFDAYAKSYLHNRLFGKGNDPKYEFHALFEAQVQTQWRDWARIHGLYVFNKYMESGALADLMLELEQAVNVPKFEIEISGVVHHSRDDYSREAKTMEKAGVVLLGKPDVFFINKHGGHTNIDWKVNGYCSKWKKSPTPGYVKIRLDKKGGCHTDCVLKMHNGILINIATTLEMIDVDWATQLSIYAWLSGCAIGHDFIAGIDQIVCSNSGTEFPDIRIAEHRLLVSPSFQFDVFELANDLWDRCHSNHFFRNMSFEDSQARCKLLDESAKSLANETDQTFLEMTQTKRFR
jgi:hypothetical protein